mgnify:CR=1 FL=1
MKFKYTGNDNTFCLELVAYGIMKKNEYLKNGMVVEVPDGNEVVLNAVKANGLFQPIYNETKKIKTNKKNDKKGDD